MVLSYWQSVDAKSLSRTVAEILSIKHFGATTLIEHQTFWGHDLDPFGSRDVIVHVTIGTTDGRFLLVIH